jgi:sulfur carrier protein
LLRRKCLTILQGNLHFSTGTHGVEIRLNGEPRTIGDGSTVADLVSQLGLQPRFVAVEKNERLVPRADHAACALQSGDRVEIVTLVGGG